MIRARFAARASQLLKLNVPRISGIVARRTFSVAPRALAKESETASALASVLKSEQSIEREAIEEDKEFEGQNSEWLKTNNFEVKAVPGGEEVIFVRKVSDTETLHAIVPISDSVRNDNILNEEEAFGSDLEGGEQSEEYLDDLQSPIRVTIVVEKPNGALRIEATAEEQQLYIEGLTPYSDAKLALDSSAEAEYKRRLLYEGPTFTSLDPSVQASVQQYLAARGIDESFAQFVEEYASFRENQEYISWLGRIAEIVE